MNLILAGVAAVAVLIIGVGVVLLTRVCRGVIDALEGDCD